MTDKPKPTGLALLREPFPANQISKLPKPTKKQTDDVRADFTKGIRCQICGAWHHKDVVHLDYVGHAALTDRLLECDIEWNWEPVAVTPQGTPDIDKNGGMWIKLTVCGVTRLGYGHADGKAGGDAIKEVIGDAMRNAAMRFGAALDLWHKGDLHGEEVTEEKPPEKPASRNGLIGVDQFLALKARAETAGVSDEKLLETSGVATLEDMPIVMFTKLMKKLQATIDKAAEQKPNADLGDNIPY